MSLETAMNLLARRARDASFGVYSATIKKRNRALLLAAALLRSREREILAANEKDLRGGRKAGLPAAMIDRLTLNSLRLLGMAEGLKAVAAQPDPVGRADSLYRRRDGLLVRKVRVPIGTVLFIYESRPNVTTDSAGLCLKSGNAIILRGGREAFHSNRALVRLFRSALKAAGLPQDAVQLVGTTDRAALDFLLVRPDLIDLVIARGGEGLIRAITEKSKIPVLKHYKGVCHVYVDRFADPTMAEKIAVNAKVQRPGVCNAAETLLLDRGLPKAAALRILSALQARQVELAGCAETRKMLPGIRAARLSDYYTEHLSLKMNVRVVDGITGAADHIRKYGSVHTDAIVTRNRARAEAFLSTVDSSSVLWNASTRLADGGEYGLGAEIGISTDKLHARGPMGAHDLTTYKWVVTGRGHLRK